MAIRIQPLALLALGLLYGGGIGFTLAAANNVSFGGHNHGVTAAHAGIDTSAAHDHSRMLDVSGPKAPMLEATLEPDPITGFNLHLTTKNFRFAPENAGKGDRPGEGHAHVYVNGEKIARLYAPWMHIADLPPNAKIAITLNSNDHANLSVDGEPIRVELSAPQAPALSSAHKGHH
ncbi:hypothetical protein [Notoacmeibacter sp. MSK16QG-6]|uniref:hypothetical protein n=1 Tax=Notoacmeibacter sp. MSK16QG-6 TaxID=2957982 RepID=UPI00209FDBD3|nr:hypothetical protein [Notoacmeibacter sp. MSK16QG-6]MCP1199784.1 hypothetical protein [Notoacmeibacter sp. MSK16QG-6]